MPDDAIARPVTDQPTRAPISTYRLQFHHAFTFDAARQIIPYLHALGATDVYASPILMARPGSMHGYDISNHQRLNPELGSDEEYGRLAGAIADHGMGLLVDFVPNHMGIDPETNPWWHDVLENGPSSMYGRFFDIDWHPVKPELNGKVLLPVLGDQYGRVLERGELKLGFEEGRLLLEYYALRLPINPRRATVVYGHDVERLREELGNEDAHLREFLSILTELNNLPDYRETDRERIAERHREKEVARGRLKRLVAESPRIARHIDEAVAFFNGEPGNPRSFDPLHELLEEQAYRLAYWRTASHEINYRRFFGINDLAGIRMEDPEVFAMTHVLIAKLVGEGTVTGLRLDHPDGLFEPERYFERLQGVARQARADAGAPHGERSLYVIAEKILSPGEYLPRRWAVYGTTGYDFANEVGAVFVDQSSARAFRRLYARVTGVTQPFGELAYQCKRLITKTSLASELNVLAHALNQISEGTRRYRDFTLNSLRDTLQEVVACFPVYRSYVNARGWEPSDRDVIEAAIKRAQRRNPMLEVLVFDFLREVLLPREPETAVPNGGGDAPAVERRDGDPPMDRAEYEQRLNFAMHFQQYTAPVQAKGIEDTAFYRYNVLVSLNEVGGDPGRFGRSIAEFHQANAYRRDVWPLSMLATSTHDTKLGEDVRARVSVLSELPDEWRRAVWRFTRINAANRRDLEGDEVAPDRNDEYRFYQVLLGTWPPDLLRAATETRFRAPEEYVARLKDYMAKATREAKVHTSWINPDEHYDQGVATFIERTLTGPSTRRFMPVFLPFARRVAFAGMVNALAQLVLKMTVPGMPDTYQGSELWNLALVDPDNRRPVDYAARAAMLADLEPALRGLDDPSQVATDIAEARGCAVSDMLSRWEDGRIKLFLTALALRLRRASPHLFLSGAYVPLEPRVTAPGDVLAFARLLGPAASPSSAVKSLIVVAPRLVARLTEGDRLPIGAAWGDSTLPLPDPLRAERYVNLVTGETIAPRAAGELAIADVLRTCPVGLVVPAL